MNRYTSCHAHPLTNGVYVCAWLRGPPPLNHTHTHRLSYTLKVLDIDTFHLRNKQQIITQIFFHIPCFLKHQVYTLKP